MQILTKRYHKERGIYAPIISPILTINYRFQNKSAFEHFCRRADPFPPPSLPLFLSLLSQFPHYFPLRLVSSFSLILRFEPISVRSASSASVDPVDVEIRVTLNQRIGRRNGGEGEIGDCRTLLYPDFLRELNPLNHRFGPTGWLATKTLKSFVGSPILKDLRVSVDFCFLM